MYMHPAMLDKSLLGIFAQEKRLCPYFDMPLQHASDKILKSMHRTPLSDELRRLVENIRTTVPDAAIRTTFIAGFPGETEDDFEKLLQFAEEMKFDKAGVFSFSAEEGTEAFNIRPRPRAQTATRRCEMLMSIQREISAAINESRKGRTVDVIIDGESDLPEYACMGRTRWDAPEVDGNVYIKGTNIPAGSIVPVRLYDSGDYDLYGEIME